MEAKKLKILIATSEMVPFAKTGGMADVTGALINELKAKGHDVRGVMPYYRSVKKAADAVKDLKIALNIKVREEVRGKIFETRTADKAPVYLIKNDTYFDRDQLYGTSIGDFADNAERFIFFNKAIFELIEKLDFVPDIIHCHDWQTGLIPAYIKNVYAGHEKFGKIKTVFTIHNLAYQGVFWFFDMPMTGLPEYLFNPEGIEFYGRLNFMKAGLVYADKLTTVSAKYSREIQTHEYGCGLDGVLRKRSVDLVGILNGVDYKDWSPQNDAFIVEKFSPSRLEGKAKCREDLLAEFRMQHVAPTTPVIGIVSRLTDQKGFDIFARALPALMETNVCFAVLGSGDEKYESLFAEMARKYPDKMGVKITFNNAIAHKIEAGSDMFIMPSKFEPCGLNQIYSLKYGTIPVVRATGGLDDTITPFDHSTRTGNGFKFEEYTAEALTAKLKEACGVFAAKDVWTLLMKNAMKADFSWGKSCEKYEALFSGLSSF